ncbi:MAG: hypothetical protein ABIH46_02665 [Chloroflexota bacterium]
MTRQEFVQKWLDYIGAACGVKKDAIPALRQAAEADMDALGPNQWWEKWGGHFRGWPARQGVEIHRVAYQDLFSCYSDDWRLTILGYTLSLPPVGTILKVVGHDITSQERGGTLPALRMNLLEIPESEE